MKIVYLSTISIRLKLILVVVAICIFIHSEKSASEFCTDTGWNNLSKVAISAKPKFDLKSSTMGGTKFVISWATSELVPTIYVENVAIEPFFHPTSSKEPNSVKFFGELKTADVTLRAIKPSFLGNTSMEITLPISSSKKKSIPDSTIIQFSEDSTDSTKYNISWTKNEENIQYTLLIYNRSHTLQKSVLSNSMCVSNLQAGTTYFICLALVDGAWEWKCNSWTTRLELPALTPHNSEHFFRLTVNVEAIGTKDIQIYWPPPKIRKPSPLTPPNGYFILLYNKSSLEIAYQINAPWINPAQMKNMSQQFTRIFKDNKLKIISPDLPWPDYANLRKNDWIDGWSSASTDEQGPVGIFVTTLPFFSRPYTVTVVPIFPEEIFQENYFVFNETIKISGNSYKLPESKFEYNSSNKRLELMTSIKKPSVYLLGLPSLSCYNELANTDPRAIVNGASIVKLRCESLTKSFKYSASYEVQNLTHRHILRTPINPRAFEIGEVRVNVVTSRIIIVTLFDIHLDRMLEEIQTTGYIVRICSTKASAACSLAVHSFSIYGTDVLVNSNKEDSVSVIMRVPLEGDGETYIASATHVDYSLGVSKKTVEFQTHFKACQRSCVWRMSDFNNVKQTEIRDMYFPYTEDNCNSTSCILPFCEDTPTITCITNWKTKYKGATWITLQWFAGHLHNISGYMVLTKRIQTGECEGFFKIKTKTFISKELHGIARLCDLLNISGNEYLSVSDFAHEINLTNLWAGSVYTISVAPMTATGHLGASWIDNIATLDAAPCKPNSVLLDVNGENMVARWKTNQTKTCGKAIQAILELTDKTSKWNQEVSLKSNQTEVLISHQYIYCTKYSVSLQLSNNNGKTESIASPLFCTPYPDIVNTPKAYSTENGSIVTISFPFATSCFYQIVLKSYINDPNKIKCYTLKYFTVQSKYAQAGLPQELEGLSYKAQIYVAKKEFEVSCDDGLPNNKKRSTWSAPISIVTNSAKSALIVSNLTASAIIPSTNAEDVMGCNLITTPSAGHDFYAAESRGQLTTFSNPVHDKNICLEVGWSLLPSSADAVLGYLISVTQEVTNGSICRMIWLPCLDCLPGYSWENADTERLDHVKNLFDVCYGVNIVRQGKTKSDLLKSYMKQALFGGRGILRKQWRVLMHLTVPVPSKEVANTKGRVKIMSLKAGNFQDLFEQNWSTSENVIIIKASSLAGSIVGALIVTLMAVFIVLFVLQKRRLSQHRTDIYSRLKQENEETSDSVPFDSLSQFKSVLQRDPDPLTLYTLVTNMKMKQDYFSKLQGEFKLLQVHANNHRRTENLTTDIGQQAENKIRNKYRGIIPYDQNRIRLHQLCSLRGSNENTSMEITNIKIEQILDNYGHLSLMLSDYLNGSPIPIACPLVAPDAGEGNRLPPGGYIAAQAPTIVTIGLFWQMIWENNVQIIVMLTRLKEREKEKCALYWPLTAQHEKGNINTETYGKFQINLVKQNTEMSYTRRLLVVVNEKEPNAAPRSIVHLQFTRWDDFSAPRQDDFYAFIARYWEERQILGQSKSPILVHCSAGVGRTGTFIALDLLTQHINAITQDLEFKRIFFDEECIYENVRELNESIELNNLGKHADLSINIFQTVLWIRKHRLFCVQHQTQYVFLHEFLAYFVRRALGLEKSCDSV